VLSIASTKSIQLLIENASDVHSAYHTKASPKFHSPQYRSWFGWS